jgi:hypothetical protein
MYIGFFLSCLCVFYERTDSVKGDREKWDEGREKGEMVYRSFSLYIIYILKMCILFGIGIRTNFRVVELSQFLWKIVTYAITVHGLCSYCQRLLQFSTQIFQTLLNLCTYNEDVHITEWHSTRDMICRSNRKRGVYMNYFLL